MDNMTGAEKAKEIRNSIFALLIAFIWNIMLLIFKKWNEAENTSSHRTHYGAAGYYSYLDRIPVYSISEKYYRCNPCRNAGRYLSGSQL